MSTVCFDNSVLSICLSFQQDGEMPTGWELNCWTGYSWIMGFTQNVSHYRVSFIITIICICTMCHVHRVTVWLQKKRCLCMKPSDLSRNWTYTYNPQSTNIHQLNPCGWVLCEGKHHSNSSQYATGCTQSSSREAINLLIFIAPESKNQRRFVYWLNKLN